MASYRQKPEQFDTLAEVFVNSGIIKVLAAMLASQHSVHVRCQQLRVAAISRSHIQDFFQGFLR
jgi:hypothetical protein